MEPHEIYTNGDGGSGSGSDSEGSESAGERRGRSAWGELVQDASWPARALAALNALRKSRQHYDVLVAGDEGEAAAVPAHRAVLAALSPRLLAELPAPAPAAAPSPEEDAPVLRVPGVAASALRDLVEFAYCGRVPVRDAAAARALHEATRRLRVDALRRQVGALLVRRVQASDCLQVRALPGLEPAQRRQLDRFIREHLEEAAAAGGLGALPLLRVVMLRESSAADGEETPDLVAAAALAWIRILMHKDNETVDAVCAREHLLYVDEWGALQDCAQLGMDGGGSNGPAGEGGEQNSAGEWTVVAARRLGGRATQALLVLGGTLVAAHVAWRGGSAAGAGVAKGGPLPQSAAAGSVEGELTRGRCAHGIASLGDRLLVLGGYDRAEALKSVEEYCPKSGGWRPAQDMPGARARFAAARLGDAIYCVGGSDGHSELASVVAYNGVGWETKRPLPVGRSHAGAAADEARIYCVGGWAGGHSLREVLAYAPGQDGWEVLPSLGTGRSQAAAVVWAGALWALGGCDAWRCLASTELLPLDGVAAAWLPGPALPTGRRSVGGAVWAGRLVAAGGSDGASSLRRVEALAAPTAAWCPAPPLRQARAAPGLAAQGDLLYCVGGYNGQHFLASAEVLHDTEGPWTELRDRAPAAPLSLHKLKELSLEEEKKREQVGEHA